MTQLNLPGCDVLTVTADPRTDPEEFCAQRRILIAMSAERRRARDPELDPFPVGHPCGRRRA